MSAGGWSRMAGIALMIVGLRAATTDGWISYVLAAVFGLGVSFYGEGILSAARAERNAQRKKDAATLVSALRAGQRRTGRPS